MLRKQGHVYHLFREAFRCLFVFEVALLCFKVLRLCPSVYTGTTNPCRQLSALWKGAF